MEIFIVSWESQRFEQLAGPMLEKGWDVRSEVEDARQVYQYIKRWMPALVVVDLSLRASHGTAVAHNMSKTRATQDIPIVFVTEDAAQIRMLSSRFEDADFVAAQRLAEFIDDEYEVVK